MCIFLSGPASTCLSVHASPCPQGFLWQVSRGPGSMLGPDAEQARGAGVYVPQGQPPTSEAVEFAGRPYGFPISAGMALRLTPRGTEPHDSWQNLLIKAPGTSYLPIPTLELPEGSQVKPSFSPNPKCSLAHTSILSGNFPNSVVSLTTHPTKPVPATFVVEKCEISG